MTLRVRTVLSHPTLVRPTLACPTLARPTLARPTLARPAFLSAALLCSVAFVASCTSAAGPGGASSSSTAAKRSRVTGLSHTSTSRGTSASGVSGSSVAPSASGATSTAPGSATSTTTEPSPAGLTLLVEPQDGMDPIYDFMSSATRSLDMTMYELSDPRAEQILVADHARGVRVRILLDRDYDGQSANQAAYSTLSAAGVAVAWANDSEIFHQKTITVDGDESAIMTGNLTSQYYATTRDFVVLDSQPADVAAIETVFASDWAGAAPTPGPEGEDLVWSPASEARLVSLIASAGRSVVVENEEMDSTAVEDALESDAGRGVDVTVVMTADSDWDAAFTHLESAGVHVVQYADTSSALYIHAKVIDVDGVTAFVGSQNFSEASLDYDRELGVITSSAAVLDPLNGVLSQDASGSAQP